MTLTVRNASNAPLLGSLRDCWRFIAWLFVLGLGLTRSGWAAETALDRYVAKDDPNYNLQPVPHSERHCLHRLFPQDDFPTVALRQRGGPASVGARGGTGHSALWIGQQRHGDPVDRRRQQRRHAADRSARGGRGGGDSGGRGDRRGAAGTQPAAVFHRRNQSRAEGRRDPGLQPG